jgi:hypothetical protein
MMANTDKTEWRLRDTNLTTDLGIIPASQSHLYFEIDEPGSGELRLPLDTTKAGQIASGMFAECFYRGSSRGGFFVENIKESNADAGEYGGRWMSVSGRGSLALLEDCIVWDDGTTSTAREFTSVTKASILITLITEAKARGGLANLTYDFSASVDTASVSWTDSEHYKLPVGTSLLDVARQFAKTGGFDFEINLSGANFVLSAYSAGSGTDLSETIYMRTGTNCEEVSSDERGDGINNALRVKYKSGYLTVSDSTSITNRRRREKLLSLEQAQTSASATTYASAKIAQTKDPKNSIAVRVYDGVSPRLFVDYDMGDYIMLDVLGTETRYRVLGIQADFDGADFSHVVLELNTILYDKELEMSQDLDWLLDQWNTASDANELEISFWAALGTTTAPEIKDAIIYNGFLYVCGHGQVGAPGCNGVAKYEIATGIWSNMAAGFTDPCTSMVQMGGFIFVAVTDASNACSVYKWNGSAWSFYYGVGGNTGMEFTQIITDGSDIFMAGKIFSAFDSQPALYHWVAGTTNVNTRDFYCITYSASAGTCNTIAFLGSVLHSGWTATGGDVFMKAIAYVSPYGVPTDKIFDPVVIAAVSGKYVTRLMAYGSDLLVAYQDAGVSANAYLGLWNGTTFTLLGTFVPTSGIAVIKSIFVYLTDIYVGGTFLTVDGLTTNNVAKYSGGAWSALTNGVGPLVANTVVLSTDLDLYVGGNFDTVDGTLKPADHLGIYFTNFENALAFASHDANVRWGDIGGTLSDQTDLQAALDLKANTNRKLDDFGTPDDNTDLNANTTNHGLLLKATAPTGTKINIVGIANGETAYTNKDLRDSMNTVVHGSAGVGPVLDNANELFMLVWDTVSAWLPRKVTWNNIKADLAAYFPVIAHNHQGIDSAILDHGLALTGLGDDDHPQYVKHSLATAVNDFLVASGAGVWVKKTLAEVVALLSPEITLPVVGTPTNNTLVEHFTASGSAGVIDGTLTYLSVGTSAVKVSVAAGEGYIRTSNDQQAPLVFCKWSASPDLYTFSAPAAGQETAIFFGISYNAGTPIAISSSTFTDFNGYDKFWLGRVSYDGTTMRILNSYAHAEDVANNTRLLLRRLFPFRREEAPEGTGGLELSVSLRALAMSTGAVWHGYNRYLLSAITSGAAFDTHYKRAGGGFNSTIGVTSYPNTQYDDGSGTLATLVSNRYGALWVYVDVADGSLDVVYGAVNATSQANAQLDTVPTTPAHLTYHGRLIGRIIFQKSGAAPVLVESAWASSFTAGFSSQVDDAIVDAVTDRAPSQNAVFDALALKEATANKDATGGYPGLTLFKINFKNAANTFTNFFTNATTAARTYTFPDKDITVAGLVDITGTNSGTNTGDETGARIATLNHAASVKSLLVDADEITGQDSAASFGLIRTTWTSVKTFLKTYFDTLYAVTAKGVTNGDTHDHNGGDGAAIVEAAMTLADNTTNNASTSAHGFVVKATAPAANLLNVVGIANGETAYTNKALFDATVPPAVGTGAAGTSLSAAHRDHVHTGLSVAPGGRLTLTTALPVTTADVTGATTVYYTPYIHDVIALWDGAQWTPVTFTEQSLALGTVTNALPYDVFGYLSAGVLAIEKLAWTNTTTRATGITLQGGRYCKTGDKTRLYLGTFHTTSTTTTEDSGGGASQSGGKRFLWNMYNRVSRSQSVIDTTDSWSYTTDTIRQANAATGNKCEFILGLAVDRVYADLRCTIFLKSNLTKVAKVGVGLDTTTAFSGMVQGGYNAAAVDIYAPDGGSYMGIPAAGYHYIAWNEKGADSTCAFVGDNAANGIQSGMNVEIFA